MFLYVSHIVDGDFSERSIVIDSDGYVYIRIEDVILPDQIFLCFERIGQINSSMLQSIKNMEHRDKSNFYYGEVKFEYTTGYMKALNTVFIDEGINISFNHYIYRNP
jgi:hypothetical protein